MKFLFVLAVAFSLTLYWQSASLESRSIQLKSVEHGEAIKTPPLETDSVYKECASTAVMQCLTTG